MRRAAVLALFAALARAEEHPDLNAAFEWPAGEGWEAPADREGPRGALHRGVRDETGRDFFVMIVPAPGADLEGSTYTRSFLKGLARNFPGARVVSESRPGIGGVPALRLHVAADAEGRAIAWAHIAVAADGRIYSMTATSPDGDFAWADGTFATFRFLRPPAAPGVAWRIGYAFGSYVLGPALLVGLVAGIVLLVRGLARGRRA
ncbi:MAG: DUF1795 domain-containing protein [Planctomycetes bacterium]|nr:DUF1795 domain-containing protein [Planctomycetota bacterium]